MLYIFNRLRKILPIFIIFFLTGCKATYNINIDNNVNIKETLDIIEEKKELFDSKNKELYNVTPRQYLETNLKWPTPTFNDEEKNPYEPIKIDNVKYYNKSDISSYNKLGLRYNYNFNQNQFSKSRILNTCYDYEFKKEGYIISFKTTSDFKCFDKYKLLDKVEVNLNTTCKVRSINAIKKEENKYTWYITEKNQKIEFELNCKKNKTTKNNSYIIILIILIYLFLIMIIYILSVVKKNKNNKI